MLLYFLFNERMHVFIFSKSFSLDRKQLPLKYTEEFDPLSTFNHNHKFNMKEVNEEQEISSIPSSRKGSIEENRIHQLNFAIL